MSLLGMRKTTSVKQILQKAKKIEKPTVKTKRGNSLITKIQNICEQVQSRLGKYANDFELITTESRLHEYIDKCIQNNIISIDTETTGLDPITDEIVGACIYTYDEKAVYIPINHISYITNTRLEGQLTNEQVAKEFQRLVDAKTKIIMFNAKFDIRVIRNQLGVFMEPSWDGFIAGKCLKEDEPEGNLKFLWKKYCSENKDEAHFTFDKMFEGMKFNLIPISTAYLYAAKDAVMTMDLYDFQKPYLDIDNELCQRADLTRVAKLYTDIELPIINAVADIEDMGVALDLDYGKELSAKYNALLQEQEAKFQQALEAYQDQITAYLSTHPDSKIETPLNISSPTQLAELFYDVLQLPSVSKKQPRGTGEEILKELNHPLSNLILDYRGTYKLVNTYIDKMPTILNAKTNRVHCSFNQYGAATGRFSSNNPNLQNIPSHEKSIRRMFTSSKFTYINVTKEIILYKYDYIKTNSGFKSSQSLTINDEIVTENNYILSVQEVNIADKFVYVKFKDVQLDKIKVYRAYIFIGSDYSQQEPKITADLSGDEHFIEQCASGKDAYAIVASFAYNKPYEDCLEFYLDANGKKTDKINKEGKERRNEAKSILLGICYGRTIETIADQLGCTKEKAQQVYNSVLNGIPALQSLINASQDMARRLGYVETKWGRRRHLPDMTLEPYEIKSVGTKSFDPFFDSEELGVIDDTELLKLKYKKELQEAKYFQQKQKIIANAEKDGFKIKENTKKIEDATRQCLNSRIQGSAADQTKIALKNLYTNKKLKEIDWRTLLLVHDEIIGECPLVFAKEGGKLLTECMINAAKDLRTGAACDATYVFSWYDDQFNLDIKVDDLTESDIEELVKKRLKSEINL